MDLMEEEEDLGCKGGVGKGEKKGIRLFSG